MRTIAFKFAFATLVVAVAFAATYTSSTAAFSEFDLDAIPVLGGAVNTVLLLGALFLLRRKNVANAALSLIVLAGVGTAYIVHTDLYLAGNRALLALLCVMSWAGLFVAFRVVDELRWGGVALSGVALLGLGVIAGGHLAADGTPVSGDVSNIRQISFQQTPNLYFVSFDAMVPRSLLRKNLGVETTGFHDLVEDRMRRFSNFFSDAVNTKNSLYSVLALDVDVYASQRTELIKQGRDPDPFLFSGRNPSALLGILHRNGYETTSIYVNDYFGRRKGPYIDNYITIDRSTVCNLLDDSIRILSFWGYCRWFGGSFRGGHRLVVEAVTNYHIDPETDDWRWKQGLTVEAIKKASANDGPQFVMAHLYVPGHVNSSFRHGNVEQFEAYKSRNIRESETAALYLDAIIRHLEDNDPDAILLVYGDHGMFLSKGLEFEDDPTFVFQDNYGVLGAVYPRDACAVWFDEASAKGWITTLDAVHAMLRCLSGGESALVEPRKSRSTRYGPVPRNSDYKEFLYE